MAETPARYRTGVTYYHGGPPALTVILPRSVTGATALVRFYDYRRFFYPPYRVTLTTERRVAEAYAARWAHRTLSPAGTVYRVRPGADLDMDIDEPEAWACDSAQVLGTVCAVPVGRLPALAAWQARWHDAHPGHARLLSDADREGYVRRAVRRAVAHGEDEQQAASQIAMAAAPPATPGKSPGSGDYLPSRRRPAAYYHGGVPGLAEILPRSVTGRPPHVEFGDWRQFLYPPYQVSVTTSRQVAETYAATAAHRNALPAGVVYQVRPRGYLDVDLDEPAGWMTASAEVSGERGTVPASRLGELTAAHYQWLREQAHPRRLRTPADRDAFLGRLVRRAVQHGAAEADVLTMLRTAGVTRAA